MAEHVVGVPGFWRIGIWVGRPRGALFRVLLLGEGWWRKCSRVRVYGSEVRVRVLQERQPA